jgi:1-acyl-sn-glycerol-3-phosphate acyltransferase
VSDHFSWARGGPAIAAREAILGGILGPLMDAYTRRRIVGRDVLAGIAPPVVFVANHCSHMDTPSVLRALPGAWRRRTAVAAAADYFYRKPVLAAAVSLAFNTVSIERRTDAALTDVASNLDRLLDEDWSLVIFAEGTRSRNGTIGRLHSGAALLATQHELPIVPVHVSGTHAVMPPGRPWMRWRGGGVLPRRHPIEIRFGPPIRPRAGEHRTEVRERVRLFFAASGAATTPDKRIVARARTTRDGTQLIG